MFEWKSRCWTGEKCPAVMFCDTSSVTPAANCDLRWQNDCARHTSVIYASLWCCEIRRVTHMCRLQTTKFIIRHFLFAASCSQYDHAHMQYVYLIYIVSVTWFVLMLCMLNSILLSPISLLDQPVNIWICFWNTLCIETCGTFMCCVSHRRPVICAHALIA